MNYVFQIGQPIQVTPKLCTHALQNCYKPSLLPSDCNHVVRSMFLPLLKCSALGIVLKGHHVFGETNELKHTELYKNQETFPQTTSYPFGRRSGLDALYSITVAELYSTGGLEVQFQSHFKYYYSVTLMNFGITEAL